MLAALLAGHPGTHTQVLTMLANHNSPYVAALSRLRLRREDVWSDLDVHALDHDELTELVTHSNQTRVTRLALFRATGPDAWARWARSPAAAPDSLVALSEFNDTADGTVEAHTWDVIWATAPNAPTATAVEALRRLSTTTAYRPALVLTALDRHHLHAGDLLSPPNTGNHTLNGHVRTALLRYARLGSLAAFMHGAPLTSRSALDRMSWADLAEITASPNLALEAARSALHPDNFTNGEHWQAASVLTSIFSNERLPAITHVQVAHAALNAPGRLATFVRMNAYRMLARHPHLVTTDMLNVGIASADAWHEASALASNPQMTAAHLYTLYARVLEDTVTRPSSRHATLARIALHPNATARLREAVLDQLPDPEHAAQLTGHAPSLIEAARDRDVCPARLPCNTRSDGRLTELALLVTGILETRPDIFTSPDQARTVLALAPTYTGTLTQLLDTSASITA